MGNISLNFGNLKSLTTTAVQDANLEQLRARVIDPAIDAPYVTIEEWLLSILRSALVSYLQQAREITANEACETYKTLSAADQQTIRNLLGGKDPCS